MPVTLATEAMGTRFELVLVGTDENQLRAAGEAALEEICRADRQLSAFRKDSQVSHLNRRARFGPVPVDPELFGLLQVCREIWANSGGTFDPGIGSVKKGSGLEHLELDAQAGCVSFASPDLILDLGAIGKGHALDLAAEVLREHEVESALLHGGTSSVCALGSPPGRDTWEVAVRDVLQPGVWAATVGLKDGALSVSAPHGGRGSSTGAGHILDPRTGSPAHGMLMAIVLHPCAARADAWSTALLVAGAAPSADSCEDAGLLTSFLIPEFGVGAVQGPEASRLDVMTGPG